MQQVHYKKKLNYNFLFPIPGISLVSRKQYFDEILVGTIENCKVHKISESS